MGNVGPVATTSSRTNAARKSDLVLSFASPPPLPLTACTSRVGSGAMKLITYDHLEGDPGLEGGENSPLFTDILNMVCGSIDDTSSDRFRVHGEPLLGVIMVYCNIALNSKSPVNQPTSKTMLTQMISIVFRRMESDQVSVPLAISVVKYTTSSSTDNSENGEISTDNQDEEKTTLGDEWSMNWASEAYEKAICCFSDSISS